jgi:hypothetical protein
MVLKNKLLSEWCLDSAPLKKVELKVELKISRFRCIKLFSPSSFEMECIAKNQPAGFINRSWWQKLFDYA